MLDDPPCHAAPTERLSAVQVIPALDLSIVMYEDDPHAFVELHRHLISSGIHIVGLTHEPNCLASLVATLQPDLVIVSVSHDLQLDLRLAKYVFDQRTGLVITQHPRPRVGDLLLSLGAAGCLALPLDPKSLSTAVVAVVCGLVVLGPGCASPCGARWPVQSPPRLPPRPADAVVLLTPSEERVMTLVIAGYRNLDIAVELNLSVGTVKNRLCTAYARLGARNRAEAAAVWSAVSPT